MVRRVLHILSQRPGRTGSGVTLDAMVRQAANAGWQQNVIVGVPGHETAPKVALLPSEAICPVFFASVKATYTDLNFPVPGMSDVMPYPSSVWSAMTKTQLDQYRSAWKNHLNQVINSFMPDIIHSNHIWLVSSLLKTVAPHTPVVATCHATGLRQMELTPNLAAEVRRGCAAIDHFCVLRDDHGVLLSETLAVPADRITVVGAGYDPDLFHRTTTGEPRSKDLLYIGKYSHAKGLPWLLDAFAQLCDRNHDLRLHVAGSGAGPEAAALRERMIRMSPQVVLHGQLDQPALAELMRQCGVCVLPSFYEGVPLVLVEAAACGCRLVSTALPGVTERIKPHLEPYLDLVPLPRLIGVDQPEADDLPRFVADLSAALEKAMVKAATTTDLDADALAPFTWNAVFGRVQSIWSRLGG